MALELRLLELLLLLLELEALGPRLLLRRRGKPLLLHL